MAFFLFFMTLLWMFTNQTTATELVLDAYATDPITKRLLGGISLDGAEQALQQDFQMALLNLGKYNLDEFYHFLTMSGDCDYLDKFNVNQATERMEYVADHFYRGDVIIDTIKLLKQQMGFTLTAERIVKHEHVIRRLLGRDPKKDVPVFLLWASFLVASIISWLKGRERASYKFCRKVLVALGAIYSRELQGDQQLVQLRKGVAIGRAIFCHEGESSDWIFGQYLKLRGLQKESK